MILYRPYNHREDYAKVLKYCKPFGAPPVGAKHIFVAVDKEGEIHGVTGLIIQPTIDPLYADNPLIANNLGRMIEGAALADGANSVFAEVNSSLKDYINVLIKSGFTVVGENKTILERYYG